MILFKDKIRRRIKLAKKIKKAMKLILLRILAYKKPTNVNEISTILQNKYKNMYANIYIYIDMYRYLYMYVLFYLKRNFLFFLI